MISAVFGIPTESGCARGRQTRHARGRHARVAISDRRKAGEKYEAAHGELVFGPGETSKQVRIPVIDDDRFDTTLEAFVLIQGGPGW